MKYLRFLALSAAAVTLTAGLGACSKQPDVAFSYDGVVYSVADMDQALNDYYAVTGKTLDTQTVLTSLITSQVVIETAKKDYQLEVSDADAASVLKQVQQQSEGTGALENLGRGILDLAKATALSTEMTSRADTQTLNQQFDQTMADAQKSINPRYGVKATSTNIEAISAFGDVVLPGATTTNTGTTK